jgi:hypothetical protein
MVITTFGDTRLVVTIVGYHRDEEGHRVVELERSHPQHDRHQPPWRERPWVLMPEGRARRIGVELDCKRCDEESPGSDT